MSSSKKNKEKTNLSKDERKRYSLEIKAYAKMLYLLADEKSGKRKFTHQEIVDKLADKFGEAPARVTFGIWAKEWENEFELRGSIVGSKDSDLLKYWSDSKKYVDKDVVTKAIIDHIKMSLVFHSKRMHRYGELEDKILSSLLGGQTSSTQLALLKKFTAKNPEADRIKRILDNFKLVDIQRGVVDSNKTFITHLEKLSEWIKFEEEMGSKNVIEVENNGVWEFEPVDIEEFLESNEFLGDISEGFYKCVVDDIKCIFYGNPRKLLEKRKFKEVILKEAFGTGKSLVKSTTYVDSSTGKVGTIGELICKGVKSFDTWGLNPNTLKIEKVKVVDVLKTGEAKNVCRMRLSSGRYIEATANHKFYGGMGWKQLQEFKKKDFIAIPRYLGDTHNKSSLTKDDAYLIGCMLSDGSFRMEGCYLFTKPSNPLLMKRVECILDVNSVGYSRYIGKNRVWKDVRIHSNAKFYFTRIGLDTQFGKYSHEKFIPDSIMRLPNDKLKIFVNAMLNTDGWLEVRDDNAKNKSPQVSLGYCSTSERMIDQLMIIFQRLGFVVRKRVKIPKINKKEYRKAYEINLYGKQAYELLKDVGSFLGKEDLYNRAIAVCEKIKWNANVDLVLFTHEDTLAYNRKQDKYKYRDFKRIYDVKEGTYYSRDKLKRLRDDFEDDSLSRLADSDIFWDRVEDIERIPGEHDVYDCVVESHHHNFIANGIVTHNSTRAGIASVYLTYLILCLRNPAKYFKLLPSSKITITNVSVSKEQAKDVVFSKIKNLIDYCPWFTNHGYMPDPRNKLVLRFDPADSTSSTPNRVYKNVYIKPGSSSEFSAVGYDVFCCIIDEATAYGVENNMDKAEIIYNTMQGRISSRFKNTGMIVMAGNPHHVDDFLEQRIKEAEDKKDIYVVKERSVWEAKYSDYDGDHFYFDYGSMKLVDEAEFGKECVIKVPITYQEEFKSNPELSVRNLAGISLESISRFISNVDKIDEMFVKSGRKNPVEVLEDGTVKFDKNFRPVNKGLHAVHVDTGITGDACGIALGHVSGVVKGNYIFYVDCLIRLKGSKVNPNILEDIRSIIYQLSNMGFNIGLVSLDGHQSTDFIQIMNRKGYESFLLSVDKKMGPYINLRQSLYEGRINCPFNDFLKHELRTLENVNDKKVDHPFKGSKDVSDALCGMINSLIEKVPIEGVVSDKEPSKKLITKKKEEQKARSPEQVFDALISDIEEGMNHANNY